MLRWVVLVLLLCNSIYFAWQRYLAPSAVAVPISAVEPLGERVDLLSEGRTQAVTTTAQSVVVEPAPLPATHSQSAPPVAAQPAVAGVPAEAPAALVCQMIGPFREKISARQVHDRLAAVPIQSDLYQINVPTKPVFWVYLGPMHSRQEAQDQHRQLLGKNIESFIITEGPLLNGVSLGVFSLPESAQSMLRQRREQGYDAKLREVPRTTPEMWLVLHASESGHLSDAIWARAHVGIDGVERRKSRCDVIATAQKLE